MERDVLIYLGFDDRVNLGIDCVGAILTTGASKDVGEACSKAADKWGGVGRTTEEKILDRSSLQKKLCAHYGAEYFIARKRSKKLKGWFD